MELSDEVLIVDTLDIPEVWTLKEFLETTMPHVRIQRSQISIIFNRIIAGLRNDPADAAKFLGFPYIAAIPEDMELRKMLANRGDVPYLGGQDIPFTRELEKILFRLFPREIFPKGSGKEAPKGGFAGFLRKIGLAG
jgi:Flp pilus assembly CpaE family ATPase